jgi:hypothetical protein
VYRDISRVALIDLLSGKGVLLMIEPIIKPGDEN